MKIKDLNKAAKILDSIKEIDAGILKIEKFAELVANGITESSFDLKIKNLVSAKKVPVLDEDGSLRDIHAEIRNMMSRQFFSFAPGGLMDSSSEKKKDKSDVLSVDLTENETLQFLGLILGVKQRQRKILLDQLAAFGVA